MRQEGPGGLSVSGAACAPLLSVCACVTNLHPYACQALVLLLFDESGTAKTAARTIGDTSTNTSTDTDTDADTDKNKSKSKDKDNSSPTSIARHPGSGLGSTAVSLCLGEIRAATGIEVTVQWKVLYTVYTVCTVCVVVCCILCVLYTVYCVCCILCTVCVVYCVLCILCTVCVVYCVQWAVGSV